MRSPRSLYLRLAAVFLAGAMTARATTLIDVAFTTASATTKTGFAATGVTANDFWNPCSTNGVANLKYVDGTSSGAEMSISGVESAYENGASDPMYGNYFYTEVPEFSSGIVVTITNLPAGPHAFYLYGHGNEVYENSAFQISVASQSYGTQTTDGVDNNWLSATWQEGVQYVAFHADVPAGATVTTTVEPGDSPYAFISGIQILSAPAPYIANPPANQFVAPGAAARFNVLVDGALPLNYQWIFVGTNISGATNSSYVLTNVQFSNQGDYSVIVNNAFGSVTSTVASLAVFSKAAPFIDVAFTDASVSIKTGFAAIGVTTNDFWNACSTNGEADLDLVDGTASATSLTISGVEDSYTNGAADPMYGAYFFAEATNFSSDIAVTIANLPAGPYEFYVYGHGNEDDENSIYQVLVGPQNYGGKTTDGEDNAWLSPVWQEDIQYVDFHANVSPGDPVAITASPGASPYSFISGIQIAPAPAPYLAIAPGNQYVAQGTQATFNVLATGAMPLAYQWLFSGTNISGATNSSYVVTNVQVANQGGYSVVVSNAYGSVTSELAILTAIQSLIDVAFTSDAATTKTGFAAIGVTTNDFWNTCICTTFNGYEFGSGALPNLKFVDRTSSAVILTVANVFEDDVNGATDPMYGNYLYGYPNPAYANIWVTITNLIAGAYDFYLYGHGNANDQNSVFQLFLGAQSYGSEETVNGSGWLSPVWQEGVQYVAFNNVSVSGGQQVTIILGPGASAYDALSGLQIASSSSSAFIVAQPGSQEALQGSNVTFNVAAAGAPPLAYQWLFENNQISEATNSNYVVTNAQQSNAGSYTVIVTNAFGGATSTVALLNVIAPASKLIDVAFTSSSATSKTGFAAAGETVYDFWNTCTTGGAVNLRFVDGAPSGAGMTISGVESTYENGAADPMFGTYFYTEVPNFSSGITVAITNLSGDLYDFYIYGHGNEDYENSVFQVAVGSQSYGSQATDVSDAAWLSPLWQEGIQYVEFSNVSVSTGQVVTITASPGASPYSFISGMQMMPFVLPTNASPLVVSIPNQFVNVNQGIIVTNYAFSTNGPISFTLASSAPAGATVTTDGVFSWEPTCEEGSTTNPITVWVTDSSRPPLSNSMTFSVVVGECVQVSIGSSVMQAGQSTCVPLNLVASVGLTNLSFTLSYPGGFLTNWNVTPSNSVVSSSSAQTTDSSHTQFNFDVLSGQVLRGTTLLGSICLDTLPGASAFVPLAVGNMAAVGPNNSPVTNLIGQTGRLVVIGSQSLLEASLDTNSNRILTLYGNPGVSYELLSTPNLTSPWLPIANVTLTDLFQNISLANTTNQAQFFKAVQQ